MTPAGPGEPRPAPPTLAFSGGFGAGAASRSWAHLGQCCGGWGWSGPPQAPAGLGVGWAEQTPLASDQRAAAAAGVGVADTWGGSFQGGFEQGLP